MSPGKSEQSGDAHPKNAYPGKEPMSLLLVLALPTITAVAVVAIGYIWRVATGAERHY